MDVLLKEFSDLVQLIYEAGLNPAAWPTFLKALSNSFECASGFLHQYDSSINSVIAFEGFGHDPAFNRTYVEHFAAINPYPAESFQKLTTGAVDFAGTLLPIAEVKTTEFYNDWMKPQGISPNHLGVVLSRTAGIMSLLCVAPHDRLFDEEPKRFGEKLQRLAPHIAKALELNRILAGSALVSATSNALLDSFPAAVFLLSAGGDILFTNTRGEQLLQTEKVLAIDKVTRRLRPYSSQDGKRFEATVLRARAERQPQFLRLIASESGSAFVLAMVPLTPRLSQGTLPNVQDGLAIIATPSSSQIDLRVEDIRAATGLSQAEARLAKALVSGATTSEYAAAAGLSTNTVRRQLAGAFLRTETNKQSDLIALLIRTIGVVAKP